MILIALGGGAPALLWFVGVLIVSVVSSWVIGIKMRREIKRDLGRKATEADLTSLESWMEAEEKERRNRKS
jgi:hypothetical protein